MSRSSAYKQTKGVLARTLGEESMLLHPSGSPALSLNPTATAVWAALAEQPDLAVVVAEVSARYGTAPDAVEGEVDALVAQLLELGFLQPL